MGVAIPNAGYDAYFAYFAECTRLSLVSDEAVPTDLTGELAAATLVAGDGNGDFTVGEGDPDGREMVVTEQEDIEATGTGTSYHAVLSFWTGDAWQIRLVTECDERAINHSKGDKVNMQSFALHVADPTIPA